MKRAALLPIALLTACAGAPAPQRAPVAPLPAAPRPAVAAPAVAAAQPASAPAELAFVLRIAHPKRTWANAAQLLPSSALVFTMGSTDPTKMLEPAVGPDLAGIVDLDRPIDVAFLGTTGDHAVASLSVAEQEVPRLADRFVLKEIEEHPGLLRVERARNAEPDEEAPPWVCAFDPGERRDGARLLCGEDVEDIEAAAAYLVQVVAREPLDADARIELSERTLRQAVEEASAAGDADEDDGRAGALGEELAAGFLHDIAGLKVDLTWGRADVEVGLTLRFASRRSPLTLALAPAAAQDAAPPPAFFRLPADTAVAFHTQGASRAELAPLREAVFKALRDDMIDEGYDEARLDQVLDRLEALALTGGPLVVGAGANGAAAEKALAAYQRDKGAPRARKAARLALQGWVLASVEEPAQTWISGVKELLQRGDELDRFKRSAPKDGARKDDEDKQHTTHAIVRAPASLPAGTLHVELRSKPLTKDAPPAHTTHLYVVPAGPRTWLGVSEDDAALVARLRVAVDPGRDEGTLGAAPDMDVLRRRGTLAGGLFSLAGLALLAADGDTPEALDEAAKDLAALAALPARGGVATPIAVTSEVLGSGAARVDVRVRLTRAGIQDAIALLAR
ncbi:hypothetical protein predicted by Glimmer/Critica [Sorangium cellulosum So ce56]|uniref:Secreted protein n=1 Tax=Sorangium cellulosum (strain So ce56) TaxID=448385 RepID=A9GLL8_SORC5|nr:hypothetical protein [Sorangium cellulosum]CAN90292.1 hypothetical protein predicted by Glimmer/Critica [Sorangium cellulosum So ce56]